MLLFVGETSGDRNGGLWQMPGRLLKLVCRGSLKAGFVPGFSLILLASFPLPVSSQERAPGSRVLQKGQELSLHVGRRTIDQHDLIHTFKVLQTQGQWAWLASEQDGSKAWARSADLVGLG